MNPSLEQARVLLRKAEEDGRAAEQLAKSPSPALWIVGFHSQQAVEKALKAVLASRGVAFARTHNLIMLAALLAKYGLDAPRTADEYAVLTPFGTAFRYDDASDPNEAELDVNMAICCAAATLAWAEKQIGTVSRPCNSKEAGNK